jgi:membrane fusion protein (multidrug efflux system)
MATEESSPALPSKPAPAGGVRARWAGIPRKGKLRAALVLVGAAAIVFVIIPRIFHALHTVSTDDAYVNSYVTFVAPRVSGQVARVLADDNNRVKKDDVLVELDPEPFRVQVAIKQAAVDTAQAELVTAQATVRSQIAQARSLRFKLQHAIEDVDNQVALLPMR